jgi:hypothetical protein
MAGMTYEESQRILNAVKVLERHEKDGDITRTEQAALNRYRNKTKTAKQSEIETASTYRGALQGVSMRTADEIAAAIQAMTGADYDTALKLARDKNLAAQLLAPEQYSKGEFAGGVGSMAIPFGLLAKATKGASIPVQMGYNALLGGGLTATPEFAGGEGGFANRLKEVSPGMTALGATMGGAAPVAGQIAGNITRGVQNIGRAIPGYGAKATQLAARAIGQTEAAGTDIAKYLRDIGEQGMLADVPGPLQTRAQGLASMGGEGSAVMGQAVGQRAAQAPQRIEDVVTQVAGEPAEAFRQRVERARVRKEVIGPEYEAAVSFEEPMPVEAIVSGLSFIGKDASGATRTKLNQVLSDLASDTGAVSAERLHNARSSLSDTISEATRAGSGGLVSDLVPILNELDNRLDIIPGYKAARSGYANTKAMDRAAEAGRKVFSGGATTALMPEELAMAFGKLSAAEQDAFRTGAREYVGALMGTARNAPAAAWGEMSKGFSDKKLRILFGDTEAQKILSTLRGEKTFAETGSKLFQGSQSAMRTEAASELGDLRTPETGRAPGPIQRVRQGVSSAVNSAIDGVLYGAGRASANKDLGTILSLQGAERNRALSALISEAAAQKDNTRAQAIVKGLTQMFMGGSIGATAAPYGGE